MNQILLIEDDRTIVATLSEFLRNEGFEVTAASGQADALRILESEIPDILLLDVSLTDGNGFSVCSAVRQKSDIPIIFLSASGDEYSVVTGLELGADDYISKPFRPRELVSRIKAALRKRERGSVVKIGNLTIDTVKGTAMKNGNELFLSALEYRLLLIFVNNRGAVLSRNRLLSEIWDVAGDFVNDNTLTVYIKRLRDKIEDDPQNPTVIKTIRGLGYKLDN